MKRIITIRPKPDSQLGQLLAQLEALEAQVEAQRQVITPLRQASSSLQRELFRASYAPTPVHPPSEQIGAMEKRLLEIESERELEEKKFADLIKQVRELDGRWQADYRAFLKLQDVMSDLQRLSG